MIEDLTRLASLDLGQTETSPSQDDLSSGEESSDNENDEASATPPDAGSVSTAPRVQWQPPKGLVERRWKDARQ